MADESSKLKLYWCAGYRSERAVWLVKELGVEKDFEFIFLCPGQDAEVDAAYRKDVHPHCTIPALVIPGKPPILESGAICLYLADRYGKFVPELAERDEYYNVIIYTMATLDSLCDFFYRHWKLNQPKGDEDMKKMRAKLNICLDYLSGRLENTFICGNELTAADCVLGYCLLDLDTTNSELLENHPKVLEYFETLKERPALKEATNMK